MCHDVIGEGSCGVVYSGTWAEETSVAVKVFKPEAVNREYVKHCLDCLKNAEPHPGLIRVFDYDLDGDPAYCVMGLLLDTHEDPPQPQNLERICGQLPPEEAWVFAQQLADAVAHMHQAGIAHCGLKTSNVFLDDDGQKVELRVTDPGQGWIGGVERLAINDHTFYAAPEQLEHPEQLFEGGFESWDIYAFGVTVYRLMTGAFPRFEDELENLRQRIETYPDEPIVFDPREYAAAAHHYPEVYWPEDFPESPIESARREVIDRCLALSPDDRYPDMQSVYSALASILADAPTRHTNDARGWEGAPDTATADGPYLPPIQVAKAAPVTAVAYVTPSKLRTILPWAIAAVFAAGAGVFYKLNSDAKIQLTKEREAHRNTLAGVQVELRSRQDDIQQNVSLVDEAALHASAAVESQLRAQRNLAKTQDSADFFFTAFLESGSRSADTPERRLAFTRAENFYKAFLAEINGDDALLDSAARATLNLARIQKGLGKNEAAEEGFTKAINLLGDLIRSDPESPAVSDHQRRKASAQTLSAELLMERGSYENGLALLESAAEAYRPLAEQIPEDATILHSVAEIFQRTGWAMRHLERYDEGLAQQARVIELLNHVAADPNTAPSDALLLSKALFERGRCRLRQGSLDPGAQDHIDAVEILLKIHQKDTEATEYRYELGRNYWALGEALAESGLLTDAGRAHTEAVKYLKELVEQHPEVPEYKTTLALDYASVALIQRDRGEPKSALEFHRGTVAFLANLTEKADATDLQRHELAVQRGTYAELLSIDNQPAKALDEARQAVLLLEEIAVKQEAGSQLRKNFQTSLAQLYGTLGDVAEKSDDKEEAVQAFLQAIHTWTLLMPAAAEDPMITKRLQWCKEKVTNLDPEALDRLDQPAEVKPETDSDSDGGE